MLWILLVIVGAVVLYAVVWWWSGRSRPLTRMDDEAARQYADTVADHEMTGVRMPGARAGF
jgi:hypothetical protein